MLVVLEVQEEVELHVEINTSRNRRDDSSNSRNCRNSRSRANISSFSSRTRRSQNICVDRILSTTNKIIILNTEEVVGVIVVALVELYVETMLVIIAGVEVPTVVSL